MANTGNSDKLKPAQRRAVVALLAERDIKSAAAAAHVGERTLHRWLNDDADFVQHLREAEAGAVDHVARQLTRLADSAAQTLEDTLGSAAAAGIKVRAAEIILDSLLKIRGLARFEERLSALEKQLNETKL